MSMGPRRRHHLSSLDRKLLLLLLFKIMRTPSAEKAMIWHVEFLWEGHDKKRCRCCEAIKAKCHICKKFLVDHPTSGTIHLKGHMKSDIKGEESRSKIHQTIFSWLSSMESLMFSYDVMKDKKHLSCILFLETYILIR